MNDNGEKNQLSQTKLQEKSAGARRLAYGQFEQKRVELSSTRTTRAIRASSKRSVPCKRIGYPYRFFSLPAASTPADRKNDLTAQGFLMRLGISQQFTDEFEVPTGILVSERTLEDFFPDRETLADYKGTDVNDPKVVSEWKRYQKLQALLKKHLRGVKVIRVGIAEIRCYIAGLDRSGNIAGLLTTCIET